MPNKAALQDADLASLRARFPASFTWGAATSAAQIEGAHDEAGKGPSIWDRFASVPGHIEDGSTPARGCDHFHRWPEDLDALAWLGVTAYRFSIAWPRILPEGTGSVVEAGLDFYDRLVDGLLARGIDPFVTLYHWDLPQALEDRGGWRNRATVDAFAELTQVVARRIGDRVRSFATHNEPWCAAMLGHHAGVHAPGLKDLSAALAAGHHILLSHGRAVEVLRAEAPGAQVGIVQMVSPGHPASPSAADAEATRVFDGELNRWFVEPPALGRYPDDMLERHLRAGAIDDRHPVMARPDDLEVIATPTDYLGINYYSRTIVRAPIPEHENAPVTVARDEVDLSDMDWEVYPDGLKESLRRARRDWGIEHIYVTENGAAYDEGPGPDGQVRDARRVRYLTRHLHTLAEAVDEGLPVEGYFVWSLLDNFEWAFGYRKRFGLFWVDFDTCERRPKASAFTYRAFLAGPTGGGVES